MKHNKIINTIHTLAIAAGLFGCVALGNAQAQTYRDRDNDGLIEISNIEQLDSIRYNLGSKTGKVACGTDSCRGYELTRNLDFNSASSYRSGVVDTAFTTPGPGWNPIGNSSSAFNTTLEGNTYTIDHLFINRGSTNNIGLFGYAQSNSRIRNIGLTNVSVTGNQGVGGLVGNNNSGTISQSYATGDVTSASISGGLVGQNNSGTISQSYATGAVTGSDYYVGGLVGSNWNGTISQCSATGNVTGNHTVGGLVGLNLSVVSGGYGIISQCFATGAVTGSDYYVGGLVGWNNVTINQSYATGAVSGSYAAGGLVGYNNSGTVLHGSWNTNAHQTENGTPRSNNNKVGIDTTSGTVIEKYILGLTLSALQSPTGTAVDSIRELGPGFLYYRGQLPKLHTGARVTVNGVNFTELLPTLTNIGMSSAIANVIQGTATTRATLSVGGVNFTANVIDTTSGRLKMPYTITNIQNGVKQSQTLSFASLSVQTFGQAPFVLSASSSEGLPVLFSASNTLVSINNNTVTIRGAGTVRITATQTGNENYESANAVSQILSIQKGNQSISFASFTSKTFGNAPFVLSATSSAGLSLVYSASNTLISINSNTVTINGAGTVNITTSNTGNNNYGGTSATQTLLISVRETVDTTKSNPTLTFTAIPNLTVGQKYVMTATSNSPVTIIFTSSDTNKVSIRGNTATAKAIGNVMITASQEANATYNPATAQQTVTVVATTTPTMYPLTPIEKGNPAIRIYPNPANDYITIQADKSQKVSSVKIYDMMGKSGMNVGIRNYVFCPYRIDIKTLPKGEYIIILYGEKGEVWKAEKVIKE